MNKKKILSIVVVILLCLVLAWEVAIIINRQIEKSLTHQYPVMDIVSNGLCNCTAEIRTSDGITTEQFQGGLLSPIYILGDLPLEATIKPFHEEDWLYRFTFQYIFLNSDNSATSYDVVCTIGPENLQLDGVTYELPGDNWQTFLLLVDKCTEEARSAEFNDFE